MEPESLHSSWLAVGLSGLGCVSPPVMVVFHLSNLDNTLRLRSEFVASNVNVPNALAAAKLAVWESGFWES